MNELKQTHETTKKEHAAAAQVEQIVMWRIYAAKLAMVMLFWLPLFIAVFSELKRAWVNLSVISCIKYEYRLWTKIITRDLSVSNSKRVDKLHK